jgi:ribosomal protein L3 glutamine methyltransferase
MRDELITIRDWLRYAVSRFHRAGLVYGHGTANALDEAAFIILETLRLPIEEIDPWLDARLTSTERRTVQDLIEARITSRKPASYLLHAAYIQGVRFFVDERVIVPRSFIGELLADGLSAVVGDPGEVHSVLDLCAGSGCLAILAANAFPKARVDAVDISADALAVAERNVTEHGLAERITLHLGDLFAPLAGKRYDLIVANPPYVPSGVVAAFAPEYAAEPKLAHAGGDDGLDIVRRILAGALRHLEQDGNIVVELGSGGPQLASERPDFPFTWLDTETSEGEVFWLPATTFGPVKRRAKPRR